MAINIPWISKQRSNAGRIGLGIGPDGLSVAQVNGAGELVYCAFHDRPGDTSDLLIELQREHEWGAIPCSIVLHPVYYKLLLAEQPAVEKEELSAALRWKLKDLLDYPLEEAAIEYFLLPEDAYRGRQSMVYAAALRKSTLLSLVDPVEECGLKVDCVEIAELAIHSLIARLPSDVGGIACVQLHEGEGFINLVEDGAVYLSRRLDIGLDAFSPDGDNTQFFDALYLEIQRSLDFYESQLGKGIITQLLYSPGLPATAPIGEFLSLQLGLNVAALDFSPLAHSALNCQPEMLRCASAVGAALGPVKAEAVRAAS